MCSHRLGFKSMAPTVCLNRFWFESMGPQCAHNAPTTRSLFAHYVFKPFWVWNGVPAMHPLCAHCVATVCWNRFGFESMGPRCAHCVPPGHSPCVGTVLGLNRWARIVCAMRPLCAHCAYNAPTMHLNSFGFKSMGTCDAPTMRP